MENEPLGKPSPDITTQPDLPFEAPRPVTIDNSYYLGNNWRTYVIAIGIGGAVLLGTGLKIASVVEGVITSLPRP